MEIIREIFSNPVATGFLGTILGSIISAIINRKTAFQLKHQDEDYKRLKFAIDAGLQDHKYYSDLAMRQADKTTATISLYPSIFSILYSLKIHDLLRKKFPDADFVAQLSEIQKEMRIMQKAFELANAQRG